MTGDSCPAAPPRLLTFAMAIGLPGLLFALATGLGWLLGTPPLDHAHNEGRAVAWGLAAGLLPALGVIVALRRGAGVVRRDLERVEGALSPILRLPVVALVLVAGFTGLGEEALFRGVLQTALAAALGAVLPGGPDAWPAASAGVAGAAALFGLAHPISGTYVVAATAIGVWLGLLFLATGNLWAPIVAHAAYDLILLLYLKRARAGA